jgi:hypothetical protein
MEEAGPAIEAELEEAADAEAEEDEAEEDELLVVVPFGNVQTKA